MPIMSYKCSKCGLVEEVFFRDGKPTRQIQCACGSRDLKKIPSSFHWRFGDVMKASEIKHE